MFSFCFEALLRTGAYNGEPCAGDSQAGEALAREVLAGESHNGEDHADVCTNY